MFASQATSNITRGLPMRLNARVSLSGAMKQAASAHQALQAKSSGLAPSETALIVDQTSDNINRQ
jgi:hypothetical protein